MQTPARNVGLADTPVGLSPFVSSGALVDVQPAAVDLAVVLPAYNEIGGIDRTISRIRAVLASLPYTTELDRR